MKKTIKSMVFVIIICVLMSNVAFATISGQSSLKPSVEISLPYSEVSYQLAAEVYQNYLKGIVRTELGLKNTELGQIKCGEINNLLFVTGITGTNIKETKVGNVTKVVSNAYKDTTNPELDKALDELIAEVSGIGSDREKLAYINDKLIRTTGYTYGEETTYTHYAYGALVEKSAVCDGFAELVTMICARLDIKEIPFLIESNNHRSNVVYIDGQWSVWDLTWGVDHNASYDEEVVYCAERNSKGGVNFTRGIAQRQFFLIPSGARLDTYIKDNQMTSDEFGQLEMVKAIKYPEMSEFDLSLGDIKVAVPVDEPTPTVAPEEPILEEPVVAAPEDDTVYGEGESWTIDSQGNITENKPKTIQAKPTSSSVLINGKKVAFEAYTINGSNYFKLRDVAMSIKGTDKQFDVGFDGAKNAIKLTPNKVYTPVGGELAVSSKPTTKSAKVTTSKIYVNSNEVKFSAYVINGNNYFKLRDMGKAINFNVTWDGKANSILIDSKSIYAGE